VNYTLQGIYRYRHMTFDLTHFGVKDFIYGRWRADLQVIKSNGQVAACMRALADTVPA